MQFQDYLFQIISLFGGLALFLFGMDVMGKALERQAGGKLQTILAQMSSNVCKGLLLGAAATAVIQSSSAITVMVVGFVNSGIMTLQQAVGVIMGSNIGTTITSWLLSLTALEGSSFLVQLFKPTTLAPLMGILGIILFMFSRKESKKAVGTILLGFMALMTGMELMSNAMAFLENEAWFARLMVSFSNPFLGILAGAALTALIQSSSASVGILQSLCATGAVSFGTVIPIILGQNIGTCVTALLSTVGTNRNARRTAIVHLLFNLVGVGLFVIVFYGIGLFFPWKFLSGTADAVDVALIHSLFNIGTTAVLLPANKLLVRLATLAVPKEHTPQPMELLDSRLLATPAVAVQQAHNVAVRMGQDAAETVRTAISLTGKFDPKGMEKVLALEAQTDRYQDALGTYLVQLSQKQLSLEDNRRLNTVLYAINDLERIADYGVHIAKAFQKMEQGQMIFSPQAKQELEVLSQAVTDVLDNTLQAFAHSDLTLAMKVEPHEQVVDSLVRQVKARHVQRLRSGICSPEYGLVLEELLTAYERCADHCSNIAVELLQVAEGKLEAHEYLSALKSGQLEESAKFAERFARYKARYPFPEEP